MIRESKSPHSTVRVRIPKERAEKELQLAWDRLEHFVNLDDDSSKWAKFGDQYPNFFPVEFSEDEGWQDNDELLKPKKVGYQSEFRALFCALRDMTRKVWWSGADTELSILLGVDPEAVKIMTHQTKAQPIEHSLGGPYGRLEKGMAEISPDFKLILAHPMRATSLRPDWRLGTFRYEPDNEFRRALYALFQQSWRAKTCPRCGRCFVADKPAQMYCSTACYGASKQGRDRTYWRTTGSERREKRRRRRVQTGRAADPRYGAR